MIVRPGGLTSKVAKKVVTAALMSSRSIGLFFSFCQMHFLFFNASAVTLTMVQLMNGRYSYDSINNKSIIASCLVLLLL